jgi:hypothetical protein
MIILFFRFKKVLEGGEIIYHISISFFSVVQFLNRTGAKKPAVISDRNPIITCIEMNAESMLDLE